MQLAQQACFAGGVPPPLALGMRQFAGCRNLINHPERRMRRPRAIQRPAVVFAKVEAGEGDDAEKFRSQVPMDDIAGEIGEYMSIEVADGLMENANMRPMLDIDADDQMILQRIRMMMNKDDFERIFNPKDRRIGEVF